MVPSTALGQCKIGQKIRIEGDNGGVYTITQINVGTSELSISSAGSPPMPSNSSEIVICGEEESYAGIARGISKHRFFDPGELKFDFGAPLIRKPNNLTRPKADWKVVCCPVNEEK